MAIQKAIRIVVRVISDGTTSSFTVKLAKDGDPYWVGSNQPSGFGGRITNWFADNPLAATPKAVKVVTGAISVGLAVSTSILTIGINPAPKDDMHEIVLDLLFS